MEKSKILNYIIAMLVSLLSSVVLVFIFAIILSSVSISSTFIKPINQVIKGISLAIGALIALKGDKGLIKGAVFGAVYSVLSFILFSIIAGSFDFDFHILLDFLFCIVIGALVGVVKVNVIKKT